MAAFLPPRPPGLAPPRVTRLGLGLAALGRPGYLNLGHDADLGAAKDVEALRQRAWTVLNTARDAGIRSFDAARSYGRAEEFLGGWLRERGHAATVGSKWGYTYVAGWRTDTDTHEVKNHALATLERQWPETLAALGRLPDLYLIHSATLETGVLEDGRVLARLAELVPQGVRVGLSTSGPRQVDTLRRALELRVDGVNPLSVVQATWRSSNTSLARIRSSNPAAPAKSTSRSMSEARPASPRATDPKTRTRVTPTARQRASPARSTAATVGRRRSGNREEEGAGIGGQDTVSSGPQRVSMRADDRRRGP